MIAAMFPAHACAMSRKVLSRKLAGGGAAEGGGRGGGGQGAVSLQVMRQLESRQRVSNLEGPNCTCNWLIALCHLTKPVRLYSLQAMHLHMHQQGQTKLQQEGHSL